MKLFQLKTTGGARPDYYIAAHTNIEALATLFMDCELSFDDLDYEDQMIEIPESEWQNINKIHSPIYSPKDNDIIAKEMKNRKYSEVLGYEPKD